MSCAEHYVMTFAVTNNHFKDRKCKPYICSEYIEEKLYRITTLTTIMERHVLDRAPTFRPIPFRPTGFGPKLFVQSY